MLILTGALLFVACFQYIDAQITITGTEIDHATQKFPFAPLNNNSTANKLVGRVQAVDDLNPQAKIKYSLLDVTLVLKNGTEVNRRRSTSKVWQTIATDINRNDCLDSNLKYYSELRQYFCIDHITGEVFVTKHFNRKLASGSTFTFEIQYSFGQSIVYASPPPFYTVLFSNCDLLTKYHTDMTNFCQANDIYEQRMTNINTEGKNPVSVQPNNSSDQIHYLAVVKVNLLLLKISDIMNDVYISIELTYNSKIYNKTLKYLAPEVYRFQFEPPIKVKQDDAMDINLFLKAVVGGSVSLFDNRSVSLSLHYTKNKDFCTNSGPCNTLAKQYYNSLKENVGDCQDIDESLFYAKYGYCEDNLAPNVTKTVAYLNYDIQEETRQPVHVISNYVYDTSTLLYSLQDVSAKFGNKLRVVNTVGHANCTSNLQSVSTPLAYFCLNKETGSLYTTKLALRAFSSDEVFNVTIKVLDNIIYPPRTLDLNIIVHVRSVCRQTTSLYRHFYRTCEREFYVGKLNRTSLPKSMETVQVDITDILPGEIFYITGLRKLSKVSNQEFGSFRQFFLRHEADVIVTRHYFTGQFSSFNYTIKHKVGNRYRISSFFHDASGTIMSEDFDVSKWVLILIRDKDYCTNQQTSVKRYGNYLTEYDKNWEQISKYCADPDLIGGKIKYGQCNGSREIISSPMKYVMNVDMPYTQIEVIPAGSTMYTENSGLTYHLKEVRHNGVTVNATENIDRKNTPIYCDVFNWYFCMNSSTGFLYTTEYVSNVVSVNDLFEYHLAVEDLSVIPKREANVTVTLRVINNCAPASEMYGALSTCVNYYPEQANSILKQEEILFQIPFVFVKTLFLRISLNGKHIKLDTDTTLIDANVKVQFRNGTTVTMVLSTGSSPLNTANEYLDINLNLLGINRNDKVLVTLSQRASSDSLPSSVPVKQKAGFNLYYIDSFNCEQTCVNKYVQWREEAAKKNSVCKEDPSLYAANFDVCLDPQPSFVSIPTISKNIKTGDFVVLSGCKYNAPYEFLESYWLKDGSQRFNTSIDGNKASKRFKRGRRNVLDYPNLPEYDVGDLELNSVTLDDHGSYQCVIQTGAQIFKSDRVVLKLTDVFETEFLADLNSEPWNELLRDESSSEYQTLATNVIQQIENVLTNDLPRSQKKVVINRFFNGVSTSSIASVDGVIFTVDSSLTQKVDARLEDELSIATNIKLFNINYCEFTIEGDENFKGRYEFVVTFVNSLVTLDCKYGAENSGVKIQRSCVSGSSNKPTWAPLDISFCNPKTKTTKALIDLAQKTLTTSENVEETSRQLNEVMHNGTMTTKHDIDIMSSIVNNVVSSQHITEEVTENVLGSIDEAFAYEGLLVQANMEWNTSTALLSQLETLAQKQTFPEANHSRTISKKHLALTLVNPILDRPLQFYSVRGETDEVQAGSTQTVDIDQLLESSITIPEEVISNFQGHLSYSYTFQSDVLFLREDFGSNTTNRSIVQSVVMSASVGNVSITGLKKPVEMLFTSKVQNIRGTSICKFWNFSLIDPVTGTEGGWSAEGCVTSSGENPNQIRCECDHLTNFAIILDVDQSGSNPLALQIISWIGCGVSLAGLFLSVLTFSVIPTIRKKLPSKILISLSLSLMGLLLVFLVGVEKTDSRIGCQVIAGMLHYFTLASFCWMAVEGLNLYRNFVKVFRQTGSSSKFLMKISAFGWGMPLVIVVATGAAASNLYGPETENDPQFCVVRGTAFYFALLLPVAAIMLGNLIVLVLVLRGIKDGSKLSKDTKKGQNAKLVQIRIAFACSVLLGSTWIFALLAVGDLRDFFQWLFCIFNSLQGLFIFIFYCLRNKEVRRQWMNCFGGRGFERSSTVKSMYFSRINSSTNQRSQKQSSTYNPNASKKETSQEKNSQT